MRSLLPLIFFLSALGTFAQIETNVPVPERSILITAANGFKLRITAYGKYIVRIQVARMGEEFFADNRYEMVESHHWVGELNRAETENAWHLSTDKTYGLKVTVDKRSLRRSFSGNMWNSNPFLEDKLGISWATDTISTSFKYDSTEHFTGLGHGYFGREQSLDLRGQVVSRNYGTEHGQQAPLIVPFYLSSKGYGVFLNSTFPNRFNFGKDNEYGFSIYGPGRMDYFVILGPTFPQILDSYTQLTGRPRMPLKSFFGLALSDKGHDHTSSTPSDENWWKQKIAAHRADGFPLDHIVNDNRWRAGGGQRCLSRFDWDSTRYPDPKEYQLWVKKNGLITTLDFNRCISVQSEGWKKEYNIPDATGIDFNTSAPDFTKPEVRHWFWNLMWKKSLDPSLGYPGDALWIDEFDEMGKASPQMKFENGTTWLEMRNYWFFLIAKSLVQEGWDPSFKGTKRPFVWVRGMTAGAQRYATLWSGDIKCGFDDMKTQVRAMQLAGLSGFPFWSHDAGGFYDWEKQKGPSDTVYRQWSMAFGSFTPFWKPHGVGLSRWPLDRSEAEQKDAKFYTELRYKLMPYLYSYAHLAHETGMPLARAMVIDYPWMEEAWKCDLQYMWGKDILVAPNCSWSDTTFVWIPPLNGIRGNWYDFWTDQKIRMNTVIAYPSPIGKLPLFVKGGSIIPMSNTALSTAFQARDSLTIHAYLGVQGRFTLYEDDGISEAFENKKEHRITEMTYFSHPHTFRIDSAVGSYKDAPQTKVYKVVFHGFENRPTLDLNGKRLKVLKAQTNEQGIFWNESTRLLTVQLNPTPVAKRILLMQGPLTRAEKRAQRLHAKEMKKRVADVH